MPHLAEHANISVLAQRRLDIGLTSGRSKLSKLAEDIDDIKYQVIENKDDISTSMGEYLPESKSTTSDDKSIILEKNIPIMKLSKILGADLISKGKVSELYWNDYSSEISKKLSFHRQIDSADSELETSSYGCSNTSELNSQYSETESMRIQIKEWQKMYWKLSQSTQPSTTDDEVTKITRKIRIYPNDKQKILFKKCFDAHNYFYNKAVESLKRNPKNNLKEFRKEFIPRDKQLTDENIWMKDVPLATREEAARKAKAAQKTSITQCNRGIITHFNLGFRSKKRNTPVFYVAKKALIKGAIFSRRLKRDKSLVLKKDRNYLDKNNGIFSITKERDGRYYVNLVIDVTEEKMETKHNICALDPGVRTFQTMYSPESIGEFGYDTSNTLIKLYRREDRLKSILTTKLSSKKRYKLKKRCALLRTKIKHIVSDLHWKTADYLTKNYQTILLPVFNTKNMVNKNNRKISKTSVRLMLGLSHYSFQQKLLYKAKMRGRHVILCKEHYTTKCCGKCGSINSVGSKKIFKCKTCNLTMDRDIHAARNILIRSLSIYEKYNRDESPSDEVRSVKK